MLLLEGARGWGWGAALQVTGRANSVISDGDKVPGGHGSTPMHLWAS